MPDTQQLVAVIHPNHSGAIFLYKIWTKNPLLRNIEITSPMEAISKVPSVFPPQHTGRTQQYWPQDTEGHHGISRTASAHSPPPLGSTAQLSGARSACANPPKVRPQVGPGWDGTKPGAWGPSSGGPALSFY